MAGLQRCLRKLYSRDLRYSQCDSGSQYTKILNVSGFLTYYSFTMYFDMVLNMPQVLNMPKFWVYQGPEYVKVRLFWIYRICLNNSWISLVRSVFQGSEYWFWIKGSIKNTCHYSKYATGSEYGRVPNVPDSKMGHTRFWIWLNNSSVSLIMTKCLKLLICQDSEHTRVLNMPSLQKVLCKFFDRGLQVLNEQQVVNMNTDF